MTAPITCKIAQILPNDEYFLAAGRLQNIKRGMIFAVVQDLPIPNPENPDQTLETLILIRERIRITWIGESTCLAEIMSRSWTKSNIPKMSPLEYEETKVGDIVTQLKRNTIPELKDRLIYAPKPININDFFLGFFPGMFTSLLLIVGLATLARLFS